ncbi:MAG: InlB B-repeat-containing protein, partial [Bacilli bacterium]|nr:InlB B-repeat-containing protein [Bacilli bacterium]
MKKLFFVIWLCVVLLLPGCGQSVDIKFDSNGGSEIPPIVKAGDFDSDNLPTPTREGYEFI